MTMWLPGREVRQSAEMVACTSVGGISVVRYVRCWAVNLPCWPSSQLVVSSLLALSQARMNTQALSSQPQDDPEQVHRYPDRPWNHDQQVQVHERLQVG